MNNIPNSIEKINVIKMHWCLTEQRGQHVDYLQYLLSNKYDTYRTYETYTLGIVLVQTLEQAETNAPNIEPKDDHEYSEYCLIEKVGHNTITLE